MQTPQPSTDGRDAAIVAALAGAFFALTALPAMHHYDSAEFAAVGWRLSLSHPPGHPVHGLLTRLAQTLVPVGDLAFRANLLSGLCVAGALGGLYRILRGLAPQTPKWAVGAAALLPAVMPAVWLQAVRAEVYGPQLALTVLLAALTVRVARGDDDRALPALALAFGLAGANHSLIGVFWIPLALWAMARGLRGLRPVLGAVIGGALGLSVYLYLPLRASAGGIVGWGRPDSAGAVWSMISAKDWTRGLAPAETTPFADNVATIAGYFIGQVGAAAAGLLLLVLLVGVLFLVRERRGFALAAAVAVAIPVASRVIYPVDPANPDLGGYLAGALVAGVAVLVMAVDALPANRRIFAAVVLPVALLLAAPGFDPGNRAGTRSAERVAVARLAEVPPDGVFVSSDYATAFQTWALRALYGARPDVAPVFRGRVATDWHRTRLEPAHPIVATRLAGFPAGFDGPEIRYEPGVEMHRLGPLAARLRPVGLTLGVDLDWPSIASLEAAFGPLEAISDADARRATAFGHAQHATHLLQVKAPRDVVGWHLERALTLAPGDPLLEALSAHLQELPRGP